MGNCRIFFTLGNLDCGLLPSDEELNKSCVYRHATTGTTQPFLSSRVSKWDKKRKTFGVCINSSFIELFFCPACCDTLAFCHPKTGEANLTKNFALFSMGATWARNCVRKEEEEHPGFHFYFVDQYLIQINTSWTKIRIYAPNSSEINALTNELCTFHYWALSSTFPLFDTANSWSTALPRSQWQLWMHSQHAAESGVTRGNKLFRKPTELLSFKFCFRMSCLGDWDSHPERCTPLWEKTHKNGNVQVVAETVIEIEVQFSDNRARRRSLFLPSRKSPSTNSEWAPRKHRCISLHDKLLILSAGSTTLLSR